MSPSPAIRDAAAKAVPPPRRPARSVSRGDILRRNRALYDHADGAVWRIAVFDALNGGRRYINMGGEKLVRRAIDLLAIKAGDRVFDLGCGNGDFARRVAELTGADVTGVEVNRRQAERARHVADQVARGSLTVIEADAERWAPHGRFRAGYSIDTLMLIADWPAFLSAARRALAGPRAAFLASFIVGEDLTVRERRYFWEQDGFIMLPSRAEARDAFGRAGFARPQWQSQNRWALQCLSGIDAALDAGRAAIESEISRDGWRDWKGVTATYLRAFRAGKLSYALVHARADEGP